jgi:hypothetical protein
MPDDVENLICRVIGGDPEAPAEILDRARTSNSPTLLVTASLLTNEPDLLARAARCAATTRDRQLVAVAAAHLDGDEDLLDALVRDHLADHPDNILAAWIAAKHTRSGQPATFHHCATLPHEEQPCPTSQPPRHQRPAEIPGSAPRHAGW